MQAARLEFDLDQDRRIHIPCLSLDFGKYSLARATYFAVEDQVLTLQKEKPTALSENEQFVCDELYSHIVRYVFDSAQVHVTNCSVISMVAFELDLKEIGPIAMLINLSYDSIQTRYCRHGHSKITLASYDVLHKFVLSSLYLRELQSFCTFRNFGRFFSFLAIRDEIAQFLLQMISVFASA